MKFAMKPAGWRYESARHSLAARGVRTKTGYFSRRYLAEVKSSSAPTLILQTEDVERGGLEKLGIRSPGAAAKEVPAEQELSRYAHMKVWRGRLLNQIAQQIDAGQFDTVAVEDEFGNISERKFDDALRSLPATEYRSAISMIRRKVSDLARAGIITNTNDVPQSIKEFVVTDPSTVSLIRSYADDRKDVQRSGFLGRAGNTAGTLAVSAVAGSEVVARGLARGAQGLFGAAKEGLDTYPATIEGPGVKNVFLEGYQPGKFSATGSLPSKSDVKRLFSDYPDSSESQGMSTDEYVQKEIDELYSARNNFSKVDVSPYDKGVESFDKGDREGLINAITDLEAQEQTLADRWMLAEQSRAQVMKPENRAAAYAKEKGGFMGVSLMGLGGAGGDVLAERTKKVGEVKRLLKEARDQLFTRRKLLRYRLQRMDSVVSPTAESPKSDVMVLREKGPAEWLTIPQQTSPKGILKDVFAKKVPVEVSQAAPQGV